MIFSLIKISFPRLESLIYKFSKILKSNVESKPTLQETLKSLLTSISKLISSASFTLLKISSLKLLSRFIKNSNLGITPKLASKSIFSGIDKVNLILLDNFSLQVTVNKVFLEKFIVVSYFS